MPRSPTNCPINSTVNSQPPRDPSQKRWISASLSRKPLAFRAPALQPPPPTCWPLSPLPEPSPPLRPSNPGLHAPRSPLLHEGPHANLGTPKFFISTSASPALPLNPRPTHPPAVPTPPPACFSTGILNLRPLEPIRQPASPKAFPTSVNDTAEVPDTPQLTPPGIPL